MGEKNKANFDELTSYGLGQITGKDKGAENNLTGAGEGSDYIYSVYTKTKGKEYDEVTKEKREIINQNTTLPSVDMSNVEKFLALWKNETGEIGNTTYTSDGKKVKYNDIYNGQTIVGDIFESGAEMWFEILNATDSTKGLADIFKYIMYKYTGVDYGITEESQISYIFSTVPYAGSDYNVHTKMSSEDLVLTKEKLKEAIEKSWEGETKNSLLVCLDAFMEIQNAYNVNAVFGTAVAAQELQGGASFDATAIKDFGNTIANGEKYFKAGKFTVNTIAPEYVNESWGNKIIAHMTKMYSTIGISGATGGMEGTDGTVTTFTVGTRTYKNYKQTAYPNVTLAHTTKGASIKDAGCAIVSVTIIANGFGKNVDPIQVNEYYKTLQSANHSTGLNHYTGMRCQYVSSNIESGVREQLKRGYPVMVHVPSNRGTFSTKQGHFFVVLSISEDGQNVYVSNPSSTASHNNGWIKASTLFEAPIDKYMKME